MAAIPDTGGAQCAPSGVMRALFRFVVLGGLVIAGWLLGSGISYADEGPGPPDTGLIRLVGDQADGAAASDPRSGSRLGVPPTVRSTVKRALSTASTPRLPVQPPVKVDVPKPVGVLPHDVLKPLVPTLEPVSRTVSGLASAIRPQAQAEKSAAVAPAAPTVRVLAAPAPVSAPGPATVTPPGPATVTSPETASGFAKAAPRTSVDEAPLAVSTSVTADTVGGLPAPPGDGPAPLLPSSPPVNTTAPSVSSGSGGGAGAKGVPLVAGNDIWAMTRLIATHRLRFLGAGDLPPSPATEPSTSPD